LSNKDFKVIVSDVNSRKGFDVLNIVKNKYGFPSILTSDRDIQVQLPLIYGSKVHKLRIDAIENFENDIKRLENDVKGELVYLPVSEKTTRYFLTLFQGNKLSKRWKFLLPNLNTFDLTSDKWAFQQFCEKHNHPVPKSITKDSYDELKLNFRPVVLKPKSGQGSVGIKYFLKIDDLPPKSTIDWKTHLIQEKITSNRKVAGAFFLRHEGKIVSEYCHQRIRIFPPEGGVTVYSTSVVYPEILDAGKRLLDDLNWEGLAMIEFMFDTPSKRWKIIELNPRLWGSVLLSAFNGSQMLKHYVESSLGHTPNAIEAKQTKRVNIRWILPFDFLALIKRKLTFKEFFTFNFKETCYVNFTYSPFWRALLFLMYFLFNIASIKRFIKKIKR